METKVSIKYQFNKNQKIKNKVSKQVFLGLLQYKFAEM